MAAMFAEGSYAGLVRVAALLIAFWGLVFLITCFWIGWMIRRRRFSLKEALLFVAWLAFVCALITRPWFR